MTAPQPRPRPTLVPDPPPTSAEGGDDPGSPHYVAPVGSDDAEIEADDAGGEAPEPGPRRRLLRRGQPPKRARLSEILGKLASDTRLERVSIGDLVAAMPGRATAALLFLFAAPNAIPTPPGTSALLGLPMIYLAYQLMLHRKPWLPKVVAARSMRLEDFAALVNRAVPLLQRAERMLRPRMSALVSPAAEVAIGALCVILALSVALPIPLGNMLPALAVSVLALGVLERDGLWVVIGTAIGAASLFVVSGVVWVAIKAAGYFIANVFG